jgi:hypothetical protein
MKRPVIWMLAISFLTLGLGATEDGAAAAAKKTGYSLLDAYVTCFKEMATQGSGTSWEGLEKKLQAMASEASRAKEAGEISLVFYSRYARILALTKLVIQPDRGSLLAPVLVPEIMDFVKDVTGEDFLARTGGATIGQLANALAEEMVNLQIYLDTLDKRNSMRKKVDEGKIGLPDKT